MKMEKYYKNSHIIDGELDNQQIMMHLEKGKYFGLNPIAKRIWDLLNKPLSIDEIVQVLLSEFEVPLDKCKSEVKLFLDNAIEMDIILKEDSE